MADTSANPIAIADLEGLAAELASLTEDAMVVEDAPVAVRTQKANVFDTLDGSAQVILQAVLSVVVGQQKQLILPSLASFPCNNANARTLQAWLRLRLQDKGGENIIVPVPIDTKVSPPKRVFDTFHIRPAQRKHGVEAKVTSIAKPAVGDIPTAETA